MKEKVVAKFSKKGEAVVNSSCNGIDRGSKVVKIDVPASGLMQRMRKTIMKSRQTDLK
ncbi:MAG: hypothetical protein ACLR6O_06685 [Eubacterium sp.]